MCGACSCCSYQVGFTATQVRLVYEKHSQRKKLERRVERIKSHSKNRVSFVRSSITQQSAVLQDSGEGVAIGLA